MPSSISPPFDTALTREDGERPRIAGPLRKPVQMLAQQDVGGRSSIHDDATARKVGFRGGAIEGPTHFSQFDPLGYELFGDGWFERGCISAHYQNPCIEGEEVRAWTEPLRSGDDRARAGMEKSDNTPVLSATLSLGPNHPETELDGLMAELRSPEQLVILRDLEVGMKGAEIERVVMDFDQHMGKLYPFTLEQKLAVITEPCRYYTAEGGAESRWRRPIIPFEMISVLTQYSVGAARFPVRQPAVGLFANQEIRLLEGPLFVAEEYLLEREIVALSESRRAESSWVRTSVREAKSQRLVATTLLNSAVMKASYPNYEKERAELTRQATATRTSPPSL